MSTFTCRGAIILCGGKSSRMGEDKALLPFGAETMLARTLRMVAAIVDPARIVVVAAADQELPPLQAKTVRDHAEYQGPLAGLAQGIAALPAGIDAVFVTGCDTPLLVLRLIDFLFTQVADFDAVVPQDAERCHPLCAVYSAAALRTVEQQLASGERSLRRWLDSLRVNRLSVERLCEFDPGLNSLRNVNTREDYLAALEVVGLSTP